MLTKLSREGKNTGHMWWRDKTYLSIVERQNFLRGLGYIGERVNRHGWLEMVFTEHRGLALGGGILPSLWLQEEEKVKTAVDL